MGQNPVVTQHAYRPTVRPTTGLGQPTDAAHAHVERAQSA
jgi:hypothetical protein